MLIIRAFLVLFILSVTTFAQTYDFKDIGKNKKFPAKYVYNMVQGANQKLFLGTENGLFSYDGVDFNHLVKSEDDIINVIGYKDQLVYQGYFDGRIGVYDLRKKNNLLFKVRLNLK